MFVLQNNHINKLVYNYIGVSGGYLADFSYRTHHEFYINCDLDINPYNYEGTTRARFIKILSEQKPNNQAKILRAILERFPIGQEHAPSSRTQKLFDEIQEWIKLLEHKGAKFVANPVIHTDLEVVQLALDDVELYLKNGKFISAVDRMHTAVHGYLKVICERLGINLSNDDSSSSALLNKIKDSPEIKSQGEPITKIFKNLGTILQNMDTLRNHKSMAHPNSVLLDTPEAVLFINSARTLLHYLEAKFR